MSDYNFDFKVETKNYTVQVDRQAHYGYFEHHTLGDERGGGLWFEVMPKSESGLETKLELTDYDGVACLPKQVAEALRTAGFEVGPEFD